MSKKHKMAVLDPICHIDNRYPHLIAPHPKNIIFLNMIFGVLPPVAKLNMDQAMFHFLSVIFRLQVQSAV